MRTGSKADLAASSFSKTMTFNRRASHVRHPQTGDDSGGLPGARQDVRLDVLSTCVDLICLSTLPHNKGVHHHLLFRTRDVLG